MSIDWFRDLIICITGVVAAGVLIFIAVILGLLYRKTNFILNSLQATSTTIHEVTSYIGSQVVKPAIEVVALVQGIRQGIDTISKFFKKEEGGKDV